MFHPITKGSIILLLLWSISVSAQSGKPISIGHTDEIRSSILQETRKINISLPEGYNATDTTKYPVIYIIDGGVEEDFVHITGIVKYNTQPWIDRFPKSIVVGIENVNRKRDCSFAVANLDFLQRMGFRQEQFPSYGGSANYISFIEKELQPYITKTYHTNQQKTLIGESFAGLLATEILLRYRYLFNTYIIVNPSLWWGGELLLKEAPQLLDKDHKSAVKVYIGASDKNEDDIMYTDALALAEVLQQHSSKHTKVFFDYLEKEKHATAGHQAIYNAYQLLYPKTAYE